MSFGTKDSLTGAALRREVYRHKKTGRLYQKHFELRDCTNSRDGTVVVAYSIAGASVPAYVREAGEFAEKFERLGPEAQDYALAEMTSIAQETGQYGDLRNPLVKP